MLCRLVLIAALICGAETAALAQGWPTRPVHVLVPQSAGGALDIVTRAVAEQLTVRLGQPVVVENRTGAGNTIAMAAVARSDPDGYTVLANSATHSLAPVIYNNLPFDTLRDLAPIIPLGNTPLVMLVAPSKHYRDVAAFVEAARAGRGSMTYASGGAGSITHLAMEAFRLAAGFEAVHVPLKGAPEAITEVLAGRADIYFSPLPAALPFLQDGRLQALAVSSSNRTAMFPDVPTIAEAGYPAATYNFWVGLFLPSRTPAAIMDRLYQETLAALHLPLLQERLARIGADPMPLDRDGFARLIENELALNSKVAKAAGLTTN
jgi:tripartite-type tricarboxylate transporter receptor subunit TctC